MSSITPYTFGNEPVRIEDRGGQPWFVLADVCRVLGLLNVSDAAARVRDSERDDIALTDAIGRRQQTIAVNEAGLYRLIMRSRKASAERFSDWVVGEVLPAIRRSGYYGTAAPALDLRDPATLHQLLLDHTGQTLAAKARISELAPKADAFDRLGDARGALTFTEAAKVLKVARHELLEWLSANRWIYRAPGDGRWIGYREKEQQGLIFHRVSRIRAADGPDKVAQSALITAKGLTRLADLLPKAA